MKPFYIACIRYKYVDIRKRMKRYAQVYKTMCMLFLKLPFSLTLCCKESRAESPQVGVLLLLHRPRPPDMQSLLRDAFLSFLDLSVGHLTI